MGSKKAIEKVQKWQIEAVKAHYKHCDKAGTQLHLRDFAATINMPYSTLRSLATKLKITTVGRLTNYIEKRWLVDEVTDCWNWILGIDSRGRYGLDKGSPAHKIVYEKKYGKVKHGLELDHLCKNLICVNPDHLEPVTALENSRRRWNRSQTKLFVISNFNLLTRSTQMIKQTNNYLN